MRTAPRAIEKAVQFQPETVSSFSQNRCPVWPEYATARQLRLFCILFAKPTETFVLGGLKVFGLLSPGFGSSANCGLVMKDC